MSRNADVERLRILLHAILLVLGDRPRLPASRQRRERTLREYADEALEVAGRLSADEETLTVVLSDVEVVAVRAVLAQSDDPIARDVADRLPRARPAETPEEEGFSAA